MNCPNCGAGISVRAPDDAQRIVCESCESLLDCSKGNELYLLSAAKTKGPDPLIPLGVTGEIEGEKYTIYGLLTRSVTFDGVRYAWQEYLLRNDRRGGYFWLIESDGHWSFVRPVSAGAVQQSGRTAKFEDKTYRHYQSASAHVDALRGEFYWKVAVGDRTGTMDYIAPPNILSRELASDEVTWSAGRYVDKKELEEAFRLKKPLPSPRGVAPHQPNPRGPSMKASFMLGGVFSAVLLLLVFLMSVTSDNDIALAQQFDLPSKTRGGTEKPKRVKGEVIRSKQFDVNGKSALAISVESDVKNAFLFVDGTLVDVDTSKRIPFGVYVAYHSGYVGGTTWSKGARRRTVYLGGVPDGTYVLEAKPEWMTGPNEPKKMVVEIKSDIFIGSHAMVVFFILWLFPLLQAIRYFGFEKRRWADSDHSGV
jgi:hypothetical protein